MSDIEARIVTAILDDKGKVTKVDDPNFDFSDLWRPDSDLDTAIKQEHYGWTLKPDLDKGVDFIPVFPEVIDVCTNKPDDTTHFNTLAPVTPEVIKLDCGYWGNYDRSKPQRNFGLVQGHDVWLCDFKNTAYKNSSDLPDKGTPLARLLDRLASVGLGIQFKTHAVVSATPFTADLSDDTLYLFIPDLHLPEQWPDPPQESDRPAASNARQRLRLEMRRAQHQDGYFADNPMSTGRQGDIQQYLENVYLNDDGAGSFIIPKDDSGPARTFTPAQVTAEKNILDRTIRSRSTWFYPPATGNSEDGEHEDKADVAAGDPAPALDLALLLSSVRVAQKNGAKIKVVQCGDLYELWMGREFLYKDFPTVASFGYASQAYVIMMAVQSGSQGVNDELQYRLGMNWMDEGLMAGAKQKVSNWLGIATQPHPIPKYIYHKWPKGELLDRHATGWDYFSPKGGINNAKVTSDGVADKLNRIKSLLHERVSAVERFALPLPATPLANTLRECLADAGFDLNSYKRRDQPTDSADIRWNKLVFDLFGDCGFQNIHGNHDGYRSDPLINSACTITSEEWLSFPGIWVEHGHRWDEYNRDGVAMGAGMTNLVYYYNKKLIEMSKESKLAKIFPQEQKSFTPGAAQWYLLVNIARNTYKSRDGKKTVLPFGIVVVGHTHSPDLVRIQFDFDD
ncbi:MAG TPA: hypothetical protein VHQ47_04435 [Phycisphaerae bacterium]|nr:hypothetical protein [Phycisphaerae bacterium]